jgi:hypothetical protein
MSSNSTECEAEPLIHAASAGNAVVAKPGRLERPLPSSAACARARFTAGETRVPG